MLALALLLGGAGCGERHADAPALDEARPAAPAAAPPVAQRPQIVVLGDSLTAGLGLATDESFPRRPAAAARRCRLGTTRSSTPASPAIPRPAGFAGSTGPCQGMSGSWSSRSAPTTGCAVCHPIEMQQNLAQIIERAQTRHVTVILAGMEAPPNYGREYASAFRQAFQELAAEVRAAIHSVPARRVAGDPSLNQADGIHPNLRGAQIVAETVWRALGPAIEQLPPHDRAARRLEDACRAAAALLTILHPLDLIVPAGQVVAITGPSGSGKSTLLGLLAGLDSPSAGRIAIDGVDITALDEDALARLRGQRIGFVFQFFHLLPSLTALENVLVPMEIAGGKNAGQPGRGAARRSRTGGARRITIRRSCRAANSSGSRSPGRWPTIRRSCWPTNRPAIWTVPDRAAGHRSAAQRQPRSAARRSCSSRTTPSSRRLPTSRSRCATAASSARQAATRAAFLRRHADAVRPPHGGARAARVVAAAAVLLHLRRGRRRRRSSRSARSSRACAIGLIREARSTDRGRRRWSRPTAPWTPETSAPVEARIARAPVLGRTDVDRDGDDGARRARRGGGADGGAARRRRRPFPSTAPSYSRAERRTRTRLLDDRGALVRPELLTQLGVSGRRAGSDHRPARLHDPRRDRPRSPAGGSAASASARA